MPRRRNIIIPVEEYEHKKLKVFAATQGKTMKAVVLGLIDEAVEKQKQEECAG